LVLVALASAYLLRSAFYLAVDRIYIPNISDFGRRKADACERLDRCSDGRRVFRGVDLSDHSSILI
jgi:hypothetical protein